MDQRHQLQFMVLGLTFHLLEKANVIAHCPENLFIPHDLCDNNHDRWVEARVEALFESIHKQSP